MEGVTIPQIMMSKQGVERPLTNLVFTINVDEFLNRLRLVGFSRSRSVRNSSPRRDQIPILENWPIMHDKENEVVLRRNESKWAKPKLAFPSFYIIAQFSLHLLSKELSVKKYLPVGFNRIIFRSTVWRSPFLIVICPVKPLCFTWNF